MPRAARLELMEAALQASIASGKLPLAPTIDLDAIVPEKMANGSYRPVVLMHGLGDAGNSAGMQSLAQSIMKKYPGSYAVAVNVASECRPVPSLGGAHASHGGDDENDANFLPTRRPFYCSSLIVQTDWHPSSRRCGTRSLISRRWSKLTRS